MNFGFLVSTLQDMTWVDFIDIFTVSAFIYIAISWLQQKTSRSIVIAVTPLAVLFIIAKILNMSLTAWLFQFGLTALAVALVVIFQEDFRRMFESLSSWASWIRNPQSAPKLKLVEILVECFATFSTTKTGALVILKGRQDLDPHVRGGVPVNGNLSAPLLFSIFDHHSPGHDGGVTVVNNRIERLGVHLPLSRNLTQVGRLGTRHAAALGLAERCDALVLCASEETGQISVARLGRLTTVESAEELRGWLLAYIAEFSSKRLPSKSHLLPTLMKHSFRKALSLLLAMGLWVLHARPTTPIQQTIEVGIVYRNLPEEWEAKTSFPQKLRLTVSGTETALSQIDASKLSASVDLGKVREGLQQILVDNRAFTPPPRIRIKNIEPSEITVLAYRTKIVSVPVKVKWSTSVVRNPASSPLEITPAMAKVRIRSSGVAPALIETESVDFSELSAKGTKQVRLVPPKDSQLADNETLVSLSFSPTAKRRRPSSPPSPSTP